MTNIEAMISQAQAEAAASEHGRFAELIVHDGPLRQTLLALQAGVELAEHNSPPAASMQVLRGRVRVTGQDAAEYSAGDLNALTHVRHGVTAVEDSVFLLTTVTSQEGGSHGGQPAEA